MPEDAAGYPWGSLNPADYLSRKETWMVILIICCVFLGIIFLMVVTLRNRISIAIELIEEGSKACTQMCSTLYFPPVPFILQVKRYFLVIHCAF